MDDPSTFYTVIRRPRPYTAGAVGGGSIAEISGKKSSISTFPGSAAETITAAGAISVGDLLVVMGGAGLDAGTITGVSDNLGNTYTILQANNAADLTMFIAYVISGFNGTPTVTANKTTPNGWFMSFNAYSGATVTDRVDGGSTFATSDPASDSLTTTHANSLVLGIYSDNTSNDGAINPTYGTLINEFETGSSTQRGCAIYAIEASTGTYTPTFDLTASMANGVYTAAFKPA